MRETRITQSDLKELLYYDSDTGVFTRAINHSSRAMKGQVAGCVDQKGYVKIVLRGRQYKAHQLAWLYVHGEWPSRAMDHINRVKTDNRIENLRVVPAYINRLNVGTRVVNSTGFVGISKARKEGHWRARITIAGKTHELGIYPSKEQAAEAYQRALSPVIESKL